MDWLDPTQCACAYNMSNRLIRLVAELYGSTQCACALDMSNRLITSIGVDSGGSPGTCTQPGWGKTTFLPPNNPEENFLKIVKREIRDKEIKYYQKLIENSQ